MGIHDFEFNRDLLVFGIVLRKICGNPGWHRLQSSHMDVCEQ